MRLPPPDEEEKKKWNFYKENTEEIPSVLLIPEFRW
uniref:Uncharacterized protein n=1 Tax=Arundo donax TaxID=35708 RepID=A0A0A9CV81_ARUDO